MRAATRWHGLPECQLWCCGYGGLTPEAMDEEEEVHVFGRCHGWGVVCWRRGEWEDGGL